jgi:hypothetical protein
VTITNGSRRPELANAMRIRRLPIDRDDGTNGGRREMEKNADIWISRIFSAP